MPNVVRLHVITRSYLEDAYAAAYGEPIDLDDHEIARYEAMAAHALAGRAAEVAVIEDDQLFAYSTPPQEGWDSDERVADREALDDALAEWVEQVHDRLQ